MINELFEKLPTEIAFMILTYNPHQTAVIINDRIKKERMADLVFDLSNIVEDLSSLVKVIEDGDFYAFYFDVAIQDSVYYEGFTFMPESSKPPKIYVPRTTFFDFS